MASLQFIVRAAGRGVLLAFASGVAASLVLAALAAILAQWADPGEFVFVAAGLYAFVIGLATVFPHILYAGPVAGVLSAATGAALIRLGWTVFWANLASAVVMSVAMYAQLLAALRLPPYWHGTALSSPVELASLGAVILLVAAIEPVIARRRRQRRGHLAVSDHHRGSRP